MREYLGTVDFNDPLYAILSSVVGANGGRPVFDVEKTRSDRVYRYIQQGHGVSFVGKFVRHNVRNGGSREFDNVNTVRGYGLDRPPYYVPYPLAFNETIGLALLCNFISGREFDKPLRDCMEKGNSQGLYDALDALAGFFHCLHSRTEGQDEPSDFVDRYIQKIIERLGRDHIITDNEKGKMSALFDQWRRTDWLWRGRTALVHGDATPTNFILTESGDVAAIDCEMVKWADPIYDIGMVCGELKHAFLWRTGRTDLSEPYITAFINCYSGRFSDREDRYGEIALKLPFFMAMTELRIARNHYLHYHYRLSLAGEAIRCLEHGFARL